MRLIDESLWNVAIYAVEYLNDTSLLRKLIAEAEEPTIEAEPVRHGRWNIRTFDLPREGYYCSECGTVEWHTSRFCPNCGAKMDGGDENEDGVD